MPVHGEITAAVFSRYDPGNTGVLADPGQAELAAGLACADILEEAENHPNVLDDLADALQKDIAGGQVTPASVQATLKAMAAIHACRLQCQSTAYLLKTAGPIDKAIECTSITASRIMCDACVGPAGGTGAIGGLSTLAKAVPTVANFVAKATNCQTRCNTLTATAPPAGLGC